MTRFTMEDLLAARLVFEWAAKVRRLRWQELNRLLYSVTWHEKRVVKCQGKEKFQTFALAEQVARRASRHGDTHRHAYHCDVCGYAHIGSRTSMGRKQRFDRTDAAEGADA